MAIPETNQPPPEQQQQQDAQPDNKTQSLPQPPHVTPNILPCSIHHDGPVPVSRRHWNPLSDDKNRGEKDVQAEDENETSTVYFRGRKLRGRSVRVPEGYHGLLVSAPPTQPSTLQRAQLPIPIHPDSHSYDEDDQDEEDGEEEEEEVINPPTAHATFTHLQLWNHETLPDMETDAFARGMGEWIRFAEGLHGPGPGQGGNGNGNGVMAS